MEEEKEKSLTRRAGESFIQGVVIGALITIIIVLLILKR